MGIRFGMAAGVVALTLTGCTQAPPAPPDTRDADAKAIREGEDAWNKDWAAKDAAKIASHYAADAKLMVPNMGLISGQDQMMTALKQFTADPNLTLAFTTSQVEVSKAGDLAYTQGTYSMTATDEKTKKPVVEKGKYVTVYRKGSDGTWKAIQDINNADAPAAPAGK